MDLIFDTSCLKYGSCLGLVGIRSSIVEGELVCIVYFQGISSLILICNGFARCEMENTRFLFLCYN